MSDKPKGSSEVSGVDEKFALAFNTYFLGCQRITEDYYKKHFPKNPRQPWYFMDGKRYVRVVNNGAHSFVDKGNGDVLKPAGWKAPAKHARGNIFDQHNGLKTMGPYGPAYLRG